MYIPVFWEDRIVQYPRRVSVESLGNGLYNWAPAPGEVEKKGTQQSKRNFGNMDFGVLESLDDVRGQILTVDLKNTMKYPATSAEKTVTLPRPANNSDYTVETEIIEADGPVENVEVYGKALNAFKVCYSGSAKNVTLKLHVIGGLY